VNKIFLVIVLLLAQSIFPVSGHASTDCQQISRVQEELAIRTEFAKSQNAAFQNYAMFAGDFKKLRNISTGSAIASGLILGGVGTYVLTVFSGSMSRIGFIGHIYLMPRIFAGFFPGLPIAALTLNLKSNLVTGAALFASTHPDAIWMVSRGLYNFLKDGTTYEVSLPEIDSTVVEIEKEIQKANFQIGELVKNEPWGIVNTLTFGQANFDHYSEILTRSEVSARLSYDIVQIVQMKLKLLKSSCGNIEQK
jgi:hypothetical protein